MQIVKRMSISVDEDIDRAVLTLRKTDDFCRCSYSEILRYLLKVGIKAEARKDLSNS